ncbi:MAG: PepSY-associated TM helix domain-containing protein [Bacteroidetes bacterium]|nr:PepSY-associated TM helix domain-containing protein [Bacteroidota bacterium]
MSSNRLRIFRKWNRILHRDIGYFFFGLTIIYCISGIALNHKKDWNPNYNITYKEFAINQNIDKASVNRDWVMELLKNYHEEDHYKKYFFPDSRTLKIFIDNGSVTLNIETKEGYIEKISKRPLFFEVNFLHYNPGKWWLWFSDLFCVGMIIIAISGLFIIAKSKNSLSKRGIWFVLAGLVVPILALIFL